MGLSISTANDELVPIDSNNTTGIQSKDIIEACGGLEQVTSWPILDLNGRMGWTDYIDFLSSQDLTAPVMRGIDSYNRPFIALRYIVRNEDPAKNRTCVETLFQRYTDDPIKWVKGTGSNGDQISMTEALITCRADKDMVLKRLRDLLNHKPITPHNRDYDGPALPDRLSDGQLAIELI